MFDHFLFQITIELVLGFLALLIGVKIIGKRQIEQITPFDFVTAIVLGEILGNAIFDDNANVLHIAYAALVWSLISYIIEVITQKSRKMRNIINGKPSIIIKDGKIDYQLLKKEKIDFDELLSALRQRDVFSVREVANAFLEPSGTITVMKKSKYETPNKSDLNVDVEPNNINLALIQDGEVIKENLKILEKDETWLMNKLVKHGINTVEELIYAEWNQQEDLFFQKKHE